ncbi:hypothetical protein MPSEU_000574600 [Mayamaea pseudoterrestris]|nr:hypothetical protein MPSEU_000574600 [Mayamaea pseudoterrestris]
MKSFLLVLLLSTVTATTVDRQDVGVEASAAIQGLLQQVRFKVASLLDNGAKREAMNDNEGHAQALIEWVRSKTKANVYEHLEARPSSSVQQQYALYATTTIPANTLLFEIPQDLVMTPTRIEIDDRVQVEWNDDHEYNYGHVTRDHGDTMDVHFDDDSVHSLERSLIEHEAFPVNCGTIQRLVQEILLGDSSKFAPYVNYLKNQPRGQLPADWSEAGQDLLKMLMGYESNKEFALLPPESSFDWLKEDWRVRCGRRGDDVSSLAYYTYVQRSSDQVLVPVLDMLLHSNAPDELNTRTGPIRNGRRPVKVFSSREIQAGEALYASYNQCADCQNKNHIGTPELLREHGFVEDYPQRWILSDENVVSFDLVPETIVGMDGATMKQISVKWIDKRPSRKSFAYMKNQLQRLADFCETELVSLDPSIPPQELDVILQYLDATTTALSLAINASPSSHTSSIDCRDTNTCDLDRFDRYESLVPKQEVWGDERPATCNSKREYVFNTWETIDEVNSRYQGVTFSVNNQINDMCFDLDNVVQICSSYRPHYHEMMVHFTARYLDEVKRVVFVGGGDSMLLHEIVKYPTLEKVVGLELDQQVTRSSFKYFGTQPHWDNPKVEWWFGDATKSLLTLPKEYFGSFDMVLVDLSETVMALSVTDELDVMEALALLIKPNGILVKNEYMYMLSQAEIFKHTLHVHWYHVPVVCSQSLILGSNGIDFMRGKYVDHGIDHLYELLDDNSLRYSIVRDYEKNETARQNQCKDYNPIQETQLRSPGILMLVDVEGSRIGGGDLNMLQATIVNALSKAGLSVVPSVEPWQDDDNGLVAILLREGYVVARTWASESVCSLDIHLWSSLEKQEPAKQNIITAFGSNLSSAYRIVAGGMFGVGSWKIDQAKNGPHLNELCTPPITTTTQPHNSTMDPMVVEAAVKESFAAIRESDIKVAVLCPYEDCGVVFSLKQISIVGEILELRACNNVTDGADFANESSDILFACEKELRQTLANASGNKIRAIVIDQHAPYALGQIVLKLFRSSIKNKRWLSRDILVVAPILVAKDAWKKVFVETFRRDIYLEEPVFNADVVFTDPTSTLTMAIASTGNTSFSATLINMAEQMENTTGVLSEIKSLRGGEFIFQDDFIPDRNFVHADYDRADPYKQWTSQEPLGFQTVFQLELLPNARSKLSASRISDMTMAALATANLESSDEYNWKQWDLASSSKSADGVSAGDGSVITVLWSEGSLVVVWDGKIHVDVNLFMYEEDFDFADAFVASFTNMKTVLRDEQPRGKGRVVNFMFDLPDAEEQPRWMA